MQHDEEHTTVKPLRWVEYCESCDELIGCQIIKESFTARNQTLISSKARAVVHKFIP
jgi:hypothetical protein